MQKIARILFSGFLATVWCTVFPVLAETPKDAELLEEVPPPPKVIEGQPIDNPTINKRKDGDNEIEEYSINGDVYMVKVTPPSGKPYYLHRADREGAWIHDGPVRPISVPTWVLFKF